MSSDGALNAMGSGSTGADAPLVSIIMPTYNFASEDGRTTSEILPHEELKLEPLLYWCCITDDSVMFRSAAYDADGPFDPAISSAGDWDTWIRIADHWKVLGVRNPDRDSQLRGQPGKEPGPHARHRAPRHREKPRDPTDFSELLPNIALVRPSGHAGLLRQEVVRRKRTAGYLAKALCLRFEGWKA